MKRSTLEKRTRISNDIMFYIYTHIDTDINLDELARDLGIDRFYMQKTFKEIFGRNIYESIKSIRLQKASNLLLTNRYSTVSEIANACGYASQTSFIRAFRARFGMTPKVWRKGGYRAYAETILPAPPLRESRERFEKIRPEIVKVPDIPAYYIRHRGYDDTIAQSWQKLQTWVYRHDIRNGRYIALLHDNPAVTPPAECHYVACVTDEEGKVDPREQRLPNFVISGGVYARFHVTGEKGEFPEFVRWVYHEWLPKSEYETTTKPPYAVCKKNGYLSPDGSFEADFYLPVVY